jgi:hypothetical protein
MIIQAKAHSRALIIGNPFDGSWVLFQDLGHLMGLGSRQVVLVFYAFVPVGFIWVNAQDGRELAFNLAALWPVLRWRF